MVFYSYDCLSYVDMESILLLAVVGMPPKHEKEIQTKTKVIDLFPCEHHRAILARNFNTQ